MLDTAYQFAVVLAIFTVPALVIGERGVRRLSAFQVELVASIIWLLPVLAVDSMVAAAGVGEGFRVAVALVVVPPWALLAHRVRNKYLLPAAVKRDLRRLADKVDQEFRAA